MKEQLRIFLIALQFYTRVPVTGRIGQWILYTPERLARSVRYFTVIGSAVGCFCAAVYGLALLLWPPVVAALLSTAAGVLLTGAFHEDGWADFCDGFGSYSSRSRTLEVMTDSRIGSYAGIGLVLMLGTKIAALAAMPPPLAIAALIAIHPLSRGFAVLIMAVLPYAKPDDDSKAKPIAQGVELSDMIIAIACALAACVGGLIAIDMTVLVAKLGIAFALMGLAWLALRYLMQKRLQGYTGDTLGATQQLCEVAGYLGFAATWSVALR